MKKLISVLLLCCIFLVGCKNNSIYNNAMDAGNEAIKNNQYDIALEQFKKALEECENDERSTILYNQTNNYINALESYNDLEYDESLSFINNILNKSEGSQDLLNRANTLKKKVKNDKALDYNLKQLTGSAQNYFASGNYDKAIEDINSALTLIDNNKIYNIQKEALYSLKSNCESSITYMNEQQEEKSKNELANKEKINSNSTKTPISESKAIQVVENYIKQNVGYVPNSVNVFEVVNDRYHILADNYDEKTRTKETFGWYYVDMYTGELVNNEN